MLAGVAGRGSVLIAVFSVLAGCGDIRFQKPVVSVEVDSPLLDYGVVALGSEARQELTVTNAGRVTVTVLALNAPAPFAVSGFPEGGFALPSGAARKFEVSFAPRIEGSFKAGLTLECDDVDGGRSVPLSGRAVKAYVQVHPRELDFSHVSLGNSKVQTIDLVNPTELTARVFLTIDGIDGTRFSSADVTPAMPIPVGPGATRQVAVAFSPSHLGSAEGWLHVTPCPDCEDTNVKLEGDGTASCIGVNPIAADFGTVELGQKAEQILTVENVGSSGIDLTEVFLSSATAPDFRFEGFTTGAKKELPAGGTTQVKVIYEPRTKGGKAGSLRMRAGSPTEQCFAEVQLRGAGGAGCLELTPRTLDFGAIATTMTKGMKVLLANTSCGGDVTIEGLTLSGAAEFSAATLKPGPFLLKQGEVTEVSVTFSPADKGTFDGSLRVNASDAKRKPLANPPGDVPLKGYAKELTPCQFTATPPRLDFGATTTNVTAMLAVDLTNIGQDACYFSNIAMALNSSPAFHLSGGNVPGVIVNPGKTFPVKVKFNPTALGTFNATLEYYVSDPANPLRQHAVTGKAVAGCLSIQPQDLDFGTVFVGCATQKLSFQVTNQCPAPVALASLVRGAGTSTEITVQKAPTFPLTLAVGDSLTVELGYDPKDDGLDSMPLFLDDGVNKRLVSAHGIGVTNPTRTDTFDQADRAKVDVLIVMDNSGSMMEEQDAIGRNFNAFMKFANAQGIDYHIGITTTGIDPSPGGWSTCPGGVDGGEAGRLFPADGSSVRIITPTTPISGQVFDKNIRVGICHWLEQGLEAAYRALSPPLVDKADDPRTSLANDGNLGFLRDDAKLALVFVSDEDDQSPQTVSFYLTFFQSLKKNDPSMLTMSSIVAPADLATCTTASSSGLRYMEASAKTGGFVESICTSDWATSLEKLSANAFGPKTTFPLTAKPSDAAKVVVKVNGTAVPAAGKWHYDAAANAVIFDPVSAPVGGSRVEITYPLGCP